MIVTCGACSANIEIQDNIADGTHIICPYCNEKTTYNASSTITSHEAKSPNIRPDLHIRRKNGGTRTASTRMTGFAQNKASGDFAVREKAKKSPIGIIAFAVVALCGLVFGLVWYNTYTRQKYAKEQEELRLLEERKAKTVQEEAERTKRMAEQEAEREKKKREFEAERERRKAEAEAEREKKRLEREKELNEKQKKAEDEKANRERIEEIERKFKSSPMVFAVDFPESRSPLKKDGVFYAIGLDYISDNKIYEAMCEHGVITAARAFSPKGEPEDVDVKTFNEKLKSRLLVKGENDVVWICGTGKSSWMENVSLRDEVIFPAKTELKELYAILFKWNCLPDLKYRLTLKSAKDGKLTKGGREISLGIIAYDKSISLTRIRDSILKVLQKNRDKSANIKPPKLKKFKPTVVFYDGDIIRSEMNVTKVPRKFKHLGTKHHGTVKHRTYEQAEKQWQKLRDEAERQMRRQEEVKLENAKLMQNYEVEVRDVLSKAISGEEIESEVRKYLLLIERSRSKLDAK